MRSGKKEKLKSDLRDLGDNSIGELVVLERVLGDTVGIELDLKGTGIGLLVAGLHGTIIVGSVGDDLGIELGTVGGLGLEGELAAEGVLLSLEVCASQRGN